MAMPRLWPVLGSVGECLWLLPSIRHDHDRRRQYLSGLWEVSVRALFDGVPHPSQVSGDFVSAPTSRQAALEAIGEILHATQTKNCLTSHALEDCVHRDPIRQWAKAILAAVEHAAPEGERLEECPRNCTTFQQYGDCDHRNPSELAAAKIALCKARGAIRELVKRLDQHEELSDILAWPAVVAAMKEEK